MELALGDADYWNRLNQESESYRHSPLYQVRLGTPMPG